MSLDDFMGVAPGLTPRIVLDLFTDIANMRAAKPQNRDDGWHMSAAFGFCPRMEVMGRFLPLSLRPQRVPPDAGLQRLFDYGHALHNMYQNDYLGFARKLWGHWRCTRCHNEVWGFMPEDSCFCQWNRCPPSFASIYTDYKGFTPKVCQERCSKQRFYSHFPIIFDRDEEAVSERGGCTWCKTWGAWEYQEIELELPGGIVGHIDGLVEVLPGLWILPDLKSQRQEVFHRGGTLPRWKPQGQLYMHALKWMAQHPKFDHLLPFVDAKLCYIPFNKNDSTEACYFVEYAPEYAAEVASQFQLATDAISGSRDTLPDRLVECQKKRRKGCPLDTQCSVSPDGTTCASFKQAYKR